MRNLALVISGVVIVICGALILQGYQFERERTAYMAGFNRGLASKA